VASWPEYTKIPPPTSESSNYLIEKSPETALLIIKAFNKI
jgi:hypothetical protein